MRGVEKLRTLPDEGMGTSTQGWVSFNIWEAVYRGLWDAFRCKA